MSYYEKIPYIKIKYEKLLVVHKSKKNCYECFDFCEKEDKIQFKTRFYCKKCFDNKDTNDPSRVIDCPVCLENFKMSDCQETNCGGRHFICNCCYKTLTNYSSNCPICRGTL